MRLTGEAVIGIIDLIGILFGRGGRAAKIAKIFDEVPGQLMAYKQVRYKIDLMAEQALRDDGNPNNKYVLEMTREELFAMDKAHDLIRKTGRELRDLIRSVRS